MNKKVLITSGCSVSETWIDDKWLRSWPQWLEDRMEPEHVVHSGLGSTGNDLIARKAIHHCTQALNKYKGEDILLVCAYTTLYRTALLLNDDDVVANYLKQQRKDDPNNGTWLHQGCDYDVNVIEDKDYPAWFYFNMWKDHPICDNYYTLYQSFHNIMHDYLYNMFAVENFCKANNITYVWMSADNTLDTEFNQNLMQHWSTLYLTQVLDYPLRVKKPIADTLFDHDPKMMNDEIHPTTEGHEWYVKNALIPFLEKNGIL